MHKPSLVLILVLFFPIDAQGSECAGSQDFQYLLHFEDGWKEFKREFTGEPYTKYTLGQKESAVCETVNRDCISPVEEVAPENADAAEREMIRASFRKLFCVYKSCLEVSRKSCGFGGGALQNGMDNFVRADGQCRFIVRGSRDRRVTGVPTCECKIKSLVQMEGEAEAHGCPCYAGYKEPTPLPSSPSASAGPPGPSGPPGLPGPSPSPVVAGLVALVVSCCISGVFVGGLFFIMNQKKQSGPTTTEMTTGLSSA